jgi:hypothetical protein
MSTTIIVELPLYDDKKYRYSLPLEGLSLQFTYYWVDRCSSWHLDIRREDQTPIILGMSLVSQYPMTVDYTFEDYGLTGYFLLKPVNVSVAPQLGSNMTVMPEFFRLFYVYIVED